jgi:hypothetical protein
MSCMRDAETSNTTGAPNVRGRVPLRSQGDEAEGKRRAEESRAGGGETFASVQHPEEMKNDDVRREAAPLISVSEDTGQAGGLWEEVQRCGAVAESNMSTRERKILQGFSASLEHASSGFFMEAGCGVSFCVSVADLRCERM